MYQHALALHRQGKLEDAARNYESVLAAEPTHVDALVHLGALRLGQGLPAESEALLRRAATVADSAEVHANLAAALQALGRREDAVAHYQRAVALAPGMVDAQFGLAACLQALGRHADAVACYEAILAVDPAHPEANFGLATLFVELDRADEAIVRYRAALTADADFAEASYGLGTLLMQRGEVEEAASCFRQALDVDAEYIDAWVALGRALQRLERDDEAMAAYRAAIDVEPDRATAHYGIATILSRKHRDAEAIEHFQLALAREPEHVQSIVGMAGALISTGRHAEAIGLCRKAIAIQPDFARAMSALSVALSEIGDIEQAVTVSRRAVALTPNRPEFCYVLTQLAKVRRGDQVLDALEAMLPRAASLSPRERCWLHFALAKAYDDIGERDLGFAQLLEGNAVKRRHAEYNEASTLGAMQRIRDVFNVELMATHQGLGDRSMLPVFIVGMPRSGTSLLEQMLASHPAVFGAGERPELPRAVDRLTERVGALPFPEAVWTLAGEELRQIGAAYVETLRPLAPDARRITDKMPLNFQFAGFIHLILPNAPIIHIIRDPVDTCLSCFSKLFSIGQHFSYDLGDLGRFHHAYQRLMAYWRAVLPARVLLEVHYERLVDDFATEARRIVAHCGLPWDDACLEFHKTSRPVRTASVAQVRQPLYRSSVGRWRPDAALLRPLLEALQADSIGPA
jgi:tetratricopeptide (TPR) repeat protein